MNIDWIQEAQKQQEWMVEIRRYLHQHPETGFDLENTCAYVKQKLEELGYQPHICGRAGLVAMVGKGTPVFLLRADMDALPIREETGLPYASCNGNMHACGHDLHTTMLLGAAKLLKEHEEELQGTVKLMFQPAEEILEGAADMIQNGVLENPRPDGSMMIHVMAGMPLETGTVIVSAPGVSAPAADYFEIQVQGIGCHGAMPNTGVDPITAAAHMVLALQEITAREVSVNDNAVITIGQFHGGNASNVIPDVVTMGGTMRAYDETVREYIKKRITEICEATATVYRARAKVRFGSGCATLINDDTMAERLIRYTRELLGERKSFTVAQMQRGASSAAGRSSGSEDYAEVSQKIPSIMLAMAAGNPREGYQYPQHHPKADFDENVLVSGSAVMAYAAVQFLKEV